MASTVISDLWNPAIWLEAIREGRTKYAGLFNSRAVVELQALRDLATGAGTSGNIPFWKDITDTADGIQVEGSAPTPGNITAGQMVVPVLNRVFPFGASALSAAVSGGDPIGEIGLQIAMARDKQSQSSLIAILRGLFGTSSGAALGNAACMAAARLTVGDESGSGAAAAELMSPTNFINAKALVGENAQNLVGGVFLVHPDVVATLEALDATNFKTGKPSDLPYDIDTYRGLQIVRCAALKRAGTTNGSVYDSYLISRGAIGYGEKSQVIDNIDAASFSMYKDVDKNETRIYDRRRKAIAVAGTKWTGTPAGQSATDAELGTLGNWTLVTQSADRVGIACIVTNG